MKCPYCGKEPNFVPAVQIYVVSYWNGGNALSKCCNRIINFQPIKVLLELSKSEATIDDWGNSIDKSQEIS